MLQLPSYFVWFGWLTSKNTRRFFISFLFSKKKNDQFNTKSTEQNTINQRASRAVFVMFGMLIYEAYQMRKYYNVYMIYCDLITKTTLYSSFLWLTRVTWLTFFFVSKSVWLLDVVYAFSCILWGFWLNNNLLHSNSVSFFLNIIFWVRSFDMVAVPNDFDALSPSNGTFKFNVSFWTELLLKWLCN